MLHRHLFRNRANCAFAAMIATFVISGLAHGGAILFVDDDAPPGGDGTTWDTAYRFLQDALTTASDPDEGIILVRVGQGTYVPSQTEKNPNGSDPTMRFQLINGVVIAGGYAGIGELDPNERDIELYPTIMDGLQSSNTLVIGSFTTASAVLDGFTITGGNANGSPCTPSFNGAGLYIQAGSPTIANCIFTGNQATNNNSYGGAVYMQQNASPSFTGCMFINNTASRGGGGISIANSTPMFTDCTFSNNSASRGGAIHSDNSSEMLVGCTFDGNVATGDRKAEGIGGAWQIFGNGNPILTDCTFVNNTAEGNGGAINRRNSTGSLTLIGCVFSSNQASDGGAIHIDEKLGEVPTLQLLDCSFDGNSAGSRGGSVSIEETTAIITNCTFTGNLAGTIGGGMHLLDTDAIITNCTFNENTAGGGGGVSSESSNSSVTNCLFVANSSVLGGAMNNAGGDLIVTNCSFSGNTADDSGGGMFNSGSVTVRNTVLWGNSDIGGNDESAQIHVIAGTTNVNYSCIQGGWSGKGGVGIVTDDPLFVDAKRGDLHLSSGSPGIDAADSSAVPKEITTDLDDGPRFLDDAQTTNTGIGDCPIVDMGPYEFQMVCLDLDGDNVVGVKDLLLLLGGWGSCEPGDYDADGDVGVKDLLILLGNWGPCP